MEQVELLVPELPSGCRVPIVHFANGTGATCASYRGVLEHLASHGFLTACFETPSSGDGTQCMSALELVLDGFPELAARRIGSLGQSTGGQGALYCVHHASAAWGESALYAVHTMAGESGFGSGGDLSWQTVYGEMTAPVLMINGSEDVLVSASWVGRGFDALSDATEAYWYEAVGAPHVPIPVRYMNESAVAWLRFQLLGDRRACEHFKAMPDSADWDLQGMQNATDC
jgi:predicted dienelactone hydrolase